VFAAASAVGVAAKYVLRTRSANVFNPAALGLVVVFHGFDTAQNWWGAMPAIVPAAAWPILLAAGLLVVARVDKLPLVLAFCATYFALFATATFVVEPRDVAEIFSGPDLLAAAFFASFMLTDPPTSPTRYQPQVACGILTAVVAVAVFLRIGTADYLLDGVLVANVFEAGRRWQAGRRRTRYASSIRSGCAPCQSAATPSSCNCSSPRSMVRKWLPAS
jgi:Na+-translocating ferredoxin:NAD+ oxidoreductase RnfD subunit